MLIYLGVVSTIADVDSKLSIDCAEDTVPSVPLNTNILYHSCIYYKYITTPLLFCIYLHHC